MPYNPDLFGTGKIYPARKDPNEFPDYPTGPESQGRVYYAPGPRDYTDTGSDEGAVDKPITEILDDLPSTQDITTARLGAEIPIIYGRPAPIGGKIARARRFGTGGNSLLLLLVWCEGEVEEVEAFYSGDVLLNQIQVTDYTGTADQTGDDRILSAYGQADDLPNICYSTVNLGSVQSLNIKAIIKGRKVYDPRSTNTEYSTNPALALADFIDNYTDYDVDWTQAGLAADYCDDLIDGTIKRWELGLVLNQRRDPNEWIEVLREYANCYVFIDNGTAFIVPDEPASSSLSLTAADIKKGTLKLTKLDQRNVPTQVFCDYILPKVWDVEVDDSPEWFDENEATADVAASDPLRITRLKMPGFFRAIHAKRKAVQFLNRANLEDLIATFECFDVGLKITKGDVIDITHPYGLTAKEFRVLDVRAVARGRWRVQCREYQAGTYSSDVVSDPTPDDSVLPNPLDVPDGPTPTVVEQLWQDEGGKWYSVFKITFTGQQWPFIKNYRVKVSWPTGTLLEQPVDWLPDAPTHTIQTPPVEQGTEYTVEVWTVSRLGAPSDTPGTALVTGDGKTLIPTNVSQGSLVGYEFGFFVKLEHDPAGDTDLRGYRYKRLEKVDYDAAADDASRWGHANVVTVADSHDSAGILLDAQPVATQMYGVRAVDSVGQESAVTAWVEVDVTDNNSGQIAVKKITLDDASSLNLWGYERFGGATGGPTVTTADPLESLEDLFGVQTAAFPADQTKPFCSFGSTVYSTSITDEWDTGSDRAGVWAITPTKITPLNGAVISRKVNMSTEAGYPTTWTGWLPSGSAAYARYMMAKISFWDQPGVGMTIVSPTALSFQGEHQKETITVNIPVSPQPHPFVWTQAYSNKPEYSYVIEDTEPVTIGFDGVDKDGGDVRAWAGTGHSTATAGDPVATTIEVTAEGV